MNTTGVTTRGDTWGDNQGDTTRFVTPEHSTKGDKSYLCHPICHPCCHPNMSPHRARRDTDLRQGVTNLSPAHACAQAQAGASRERGWGCT